MSAVKKLELIGVEDYLAGELVSRVKHEYVGGVVYAMAGARNLHNIIAGNIFATLHTKLRGQKCRPFNSDTKVRVRLPTQWRFYYPDCQVVCRQNPAEDSFQDDPVIIFEVLSNSTRRTDQGEKKDAYLTIPALCIYAVVEQETANVVVYRRTDAGFVPEVYEGLEAIIPLPEIKSELPLAEIFADVEFQAEPVNEEDQTR